MSDQTSEPLRGIDVLIYQTLIAAGLLLARRGLLKARIFYRHRQIMRLIKKNNIGTLTDNEDLLLQGYVHKGLVILGPMDDRWIPQASLSSKAVQELCRIRKSPR